MSNSSGESKKSQRDKLRENARLAREAERKRRSRNRLFLQGGITLVVLAAALIAVVLIVNASHAIPVVSAGHSPKNMKAGGIVFEGSAGVAKPLTASNTTASQAPSPEGTVTTAGVPHVVTYIDWSCPVCKQFEATYASKLQSLAATGKITLEIHPVAILDRNFLSSAYSTRAANAAACVANFEPDKFLAVQGEFYDHQPEEQTNGLTNAQIIGLVKDAGADTPSVEACINNESYKAWVSADTQRVVNTTSLIDPSSGHFGTPTVFIKGKRWAGTTDLLSDIAAAS